MAKEKVYIVLNHLHSFDSKKGWQVTERVEFVNNLKNKHYQTSSAIGDYLNRKIITGSNTFTEYAGFENYIRSKYRDQMSELDKLYESQRVVIDTREDIIVDQFGNSRLKTVFDV